MIKELIYYTSLKELSKAIELQLRLTNSRKHSEMEKNIDRALNKLK